MDKLLIRVVAVMWFLLSFIVSGIAQTAVPIEMEPMHRLKFENEFVRLFDVLVPVGEATKYHVHLYDGLSVRVSNAQIIDEEISGEKKPWDMKYGVATFGARPSPLTHRVINSGKTDFRNIFIEILPSKNPVKAGPFAILSDGHVIVIDNDRVRVNRLALKPGESSKMHTHQMRGLGIVLYDSKIENTASDGTKRRLEPKAGDHVWQGSGDGSRLCALGRQGRVRVRPGAARGRYHVRVQIHLVPLR